MSLGSSWIRQPGQAEIGALVGQLSHGRSPEEKDIADAHTVLASGYELRPDPSGEGRYLLKKSGGLTLKLRHGVVFAPACCGMAETRLGTLRELLDQGKLP